ncbi:immunoglobulin-like domain-containing protein [Halomonas sp. PA16-9]|uniref:immunoglobulin-like domain-containing protein n=1 Tax=Halomonas sp. PA16-9 TaxID=2576841 RepID=UPI003FA5D2EE
MTRKATTSSWTARTSPWPLKTPRPPTAARSRTSPGRAAETTVIDTIDTVTATLSADSDSVAEGGTVTYTVTLTGPQGADLSGHNGLEFRLADGSTVTIAAGELSGSATVTAADDAFEGGQATWSTASPR